MINAKPVPISTMTLCQLRLFVSMPLAGKIALVDTETFEVVGGIEAGEQPMRAELQADERYLWVGNNATTAEQSGVTSSTQRI